MLPRKAGECAPMDWQQCRATTGILSDVIPLMWSPSRELYASSRRISESTRHGGRQRREILGIRSSVQQRSARSSPPRRRSFTLYYITHKFIFHVQIWTVDITMSWTHRAWVNYVKAGAGRRIQCLLRPGWMLADYSILLYQHGWKLVLQ